MTDEFLEMDDEPLVGIGIDDLGFCGCGISEDCVKVVGEVLEIIGDNSKKNYVFLDEFPKKYPEEFMYILLYLLDNRGYTEHGVGVMPCWLTEKGRGLLDKIKAAESLESEGIDETEGA